MALELQANREPDFSSLVSPLSPRRMAARVFYLLLGECGHVCVGDTHRPEATVGTPLDKSALHVLTVLAAQQILRLEQEKPYGRLLIQPGPRFHCG